MCVCVFVCNCVCVCLCVTVCVCVMCGELCVDVCMCTHNCMHIFGVSAHCAVDTCVLDMFNTFTKHIVSGQVVRVGAEVPRIF